MRQLVIDTNKNSVEIMRDLVLHMKRFGLSFTSEYYMSSPYAILRGKTSVIYRTRRERFKHTGVYIVCARDNRDLNALLGLGLEAEDNSEDGVRPNAVYIPENQLNDAFLLLAKNPANRAVMNEKTQKETKTWIIPWNPDYYPGYRIIFDYCPFVDQHQQVEASEGDIAYIYITKGSESGRNTACERAIKYKCVIGNTNKPETTQDESAFGGTEPGLEGRWMELKRLFTFRDPGVTLNELHEHGLKEGNCLMSQQSISSELESYLKSKETPSNDAARPHTWLWAPGENAFLWKQCLDEGVMGIQFNRFELGNLKRYKTENDVWYHCKGYDRILKKTDRISKPALSMITSFCHEINEDDIIIAKRGANRIIGVGRVSSDYYYRRSGGFMKHRRDVEWINTSEYTVRTAIRKTLTDITERKDLLNKFPHHLNDEPNEYVKQIERNLQKLTGKEREHVAKYRINQTAFRSRLLRKHNGTCCLCGMDLTSLLKAGHIKPWAKSGAEEKCDVNNGLLLCPNHDALFDEGLISFRDNGRIMISKTLSVANRKLLGVSSDMRIDVDNEMKKYLEYHRENKFGK